MLECYREITRKSLKLNMTII